MNKEITITSASVYDARALAELVGLANSFSSRITLVMDNRSINAKSIMGIFSLDLTKPITLEAHTENDAELEGELEPFIYKEDVE